MVADCCTDLQMLSEYEQLAEQSITGWLITGLFETMHGLIDPPDTETLCQHSDWLRAFTRTQKIEWKKFNSASQRIENELNKSHTDNCFWFCFGGEKLRFTTLMKPFWTAIFLAKDIY